MLQFGSINSNNILLLSTIDSTNSYAHQLLATQNNLHGCIIQAYQQTNGRGQRGNTWQSEPNTNLLMSIIIDHQSSDLYSQFVLNMAVCLGIAEVVYRYLPNKKCTVKWSNDIYINNQKVGGVLIENIIKGSKWAHSIIGIGINVNSELFDATLSKATSIFLNNGKNIDLLVFRNEIIDCINDYLLFAKSDEEGICNKYNELLYKKNDTQSFLVNDKIEQYKIIRVGLNGEVILKNNEGENSFAYGMAKQIVEE